jgi:hypothetical protein
MSLKIENVEPVLAEVKAEEETYLTYGRHLPSHSPPSQLRNTTYTVNCKCVLSVVMLLLATGRWLRQKIETFREGALHSVY